MIVYIVLALLIYSLLVCVSYLLVENRELRNKKKYLLHNIKDLKKKNKESLVKKEKETRIAVHKAWEIEYKKLLNKRDIKELL